MAAIPRITIFDTSVVTDNLGDEIIMDSVNRELKPLLDTYLAIRVPTHDQIGAVSRRNLQASEYSFVGGTNILCAHWWKHRQWKIGFSDAWRIGHPILLGVGWHNYQLPTDPLTGFMLRSLLSKDYIHSVRDGYTQERLRKIGIKNVINTACPTMWNLTPDLCKSIPAARAKNAVITITCYNQNAEIDKKWIEAILKEYETVYLWPQMSDDLKYFNEMLPGTVKIIPPNLAAYDSFLSSTEADYIGTRLHGGIRALQHKKRSLILEIDNRAAEIARDTQLATVKRDNVPGILSWIGTEKATNIVLPVDNITKWREQLLGMLSRPRVEGGSVKASAQGSTAGYNAHGRLTVGQ